MTSYQSGLMAEWRARWFLRRRFFRILHTRYVTGRHTGRAEIDIIARRGNLIIFVEVKYRPDMTTAWDAISGHQSHRLRAAAETYLAQHHWTGDARMDVIAVCGRRIHWVKNCL